jgi:hypothetical protein
VLLEHSGGQPRCTVRASLGSVHLAGSFGHANDPHGPPAEEAFEQPPLLIDMAPTILVTPSADEMEEHLRGLG